MGIHFVSCSISQTLLLAMDKPCGITLLYQPVMDSNYSSLIDEMTNIIIRPRRDTYLPEKLGPTHLIIKTKSSNPHQHLHKHKYIEVVRKDITLELNNQKIQLSFFTPIETASKTPKPAENRQSAKNPQNKKKCVIYLHANSGSRVQGLQLAKYILPLGWSMAVFDYRGSGISDGQYTSMGVNQSQDLQKVIQHLSGAEQVEEYSLWGRSMGAVTILYYLTKQYYKNYQNGIIISGIVLDSPFSNMRKLMHEIGANNVGLPEFVFLPVVNSITEQLVTKMGFNLIAELDLVARIKQIQQKNKQWQQALSNINCLFLTSTQDKLVNSSHVQILHRQCPFLQKELHFFNGQHNEARSDSLKTKCATFLCQTTTKPINEDQKLKIGSSSFINTANQPTKNHQMPNKPECVHQEYSRKQSQFIHPMPKNETSKSQLLNRRANDPNQHHKQQQAHIGVQPQANSFNGASYQAKAQMPQQNNTTIVINNNFHFNFNLFSKPPNDISEIPLINLKEQGSMTDRLSESHSNNYKLFMPYSSKVQRRNYDPHNYSSISNHSSMSNSSSISNASIHNHPMHSSSYLQSQPAIQNESLFYSAKIEQQSRTNHPTAFHPQIKEFTARQGQSSILSQENEQSRSRHHIQIPLIKFERMESNNQKPYNIARKIEIRPNVQQKLLVRSPKASESFLLKKDTQAAQKQKLSLSELRKIQRQVHQKSDIKSSKLDYSNKQKSQKELQLLNFKNQDIFKDTEAWNYKSQDNPTDAQRSQHSKDLKTMKTSLMAKRKINDRKNSDSINIHSFKYNPVKTEEYNSKQPKLEPFEKEGGSTHGKLLYKIKIEGL